jgi:hypothetical protein
MPSAPSRSDREPEHQSLTRLKTDPNVWLTDTASILKAADLK